MWPFTKAKRPARVAPSITFVDGPTWSALGGTAQSITPQAAESLAAALAAVNAIGGTIASLPAYVVRSDNSREEVSRHPLQKLIDNGVNENESWTDFIEGVLASCLLRGNALGEIITDSRGELSGLRTLPWQQVMPWVAEDGELVFDYLPVLPPHAGVKRRYLRSDVLFAKDRSDDGYVGRSRISRAAQSMQSALDLQRQGTQFYGNMARPAGVITAPGRISAETAARLQKDWDEQYRGERLGKTAVLPEGLKWERIALMSAEDAELLANKEFSVADVGRIFGVPAFLLNQSDKASTFASAREGTRFFATATLAPWCQRLQRAFRQSVLAPEFSLLIDLDSLLKADVGELYSALLKARQGGWISPNDAREETGWPHVPDGDSIEPPVAGGRPAGDEPPVEPTKVFDLPQRRSRDGN